MSPFVTKKLEIQVVAAVAAVGISSGRLLVAKEVASMRRCGEIAFSSGLGCFDAWDTRDACLRVDGIPFIGLICLDSTGSPQQVYVLRYF